MADMDVDNPILQEDIGGEEPRFDEGEGEPTMKDGSDDDSSEEEEENEEEARKIREGFIVDEVEDDDDDEDDDEVRHRKRRKKRRKHTHEETGLDLDEDDLDLVAENTGTRIVPRGQNKLTRLRRGRASPSASPAVPTQRPLLPELSDDENENDLAHMFDDRVGDDQDLDDLDLDEDAGFIDDDDEDEDQEMGEEEREARRRQKIKEVRERRRQQGTRPEFSGMDQTTWDEIYDVFGDGTDYAWALDDEDVVEEDMPAKPEMRYEDVFEPSEIRARHLTSDDDLIRARDVPERMQLVTSTLTSNMTLALNTDFDKEDLMEASEWVALRLSERTQDQYFRPEGSMHHLLQEFIEAIQRSLEFILCDNLEVPYIWTHRKDYISNFDTVQKTRTELMSRDELWRVAILGARFKALCDRRKALEGTYKRMGVKDEYFEREVKTKINSLEVVVDVADWLSLKHYKQRKDRERDDLMEEDGGGVKKHKMPSRLSAYEIAQNTVVSRLAKSFGLAAHEVVLNFIHGAKRHFVEDQDVAPETYAEQFISGAPGATSADDVLQTARMILATELGKDPLLRVEARKRFKESATVSITPTEKGLIKIDDTHPYFNFKYLKPKPVAKLKSEPQFLHILAAEAEHLVNVSIQLTSQTHEAFEKRLVDAFLSDNESDSAGAWNEQRRQVIREALDKYLLPAGVKYVKEWLKEEIEETLAKRCGDLLEERIDVAPYRPSEFEKGEVPAVLALSWGKGDPQRDPIIAVFLDEAGHVRDHGRFENLTDPDQRGDFEALLKKRKPDVIVIGGFAHNTSRLHERLKEICGHPRDVPDTAPTSNNANVAPEKNPSSSSSWGAPPAAAGSDWGGGGASTTGWGDTAATSDGWGASAAPTAASTGWGDAATSGAGWGDSAGAAAGWGTSQPNAGSSSQNPSSGNAAGPHRADPGRPTPNVVETASGDVPVPIIYVPDEVARIYQHSKRAGDEFGSLPVIGRYCVGLARYVQSPVNEYAALGPDIAAITFDEGVQHLVPRERLLIAFERAIVNIVNKVGVDIHRAMTDSYHQLLLPYVAGLGPRKAEVIMKRIAALGGTLVNRGKLIQEGIMTKQIFVNAAGFLRIPQDPDYKEPRARDMNVTDLPDPLDGTRIHPEDYDLARKMATDALELDEEDVAHQHPSHVVAQLMADEEGSKKLDELSLDDFAISLQEKTEDLKRSTLDLIHDELNHPFRELREDFPKLTPWEVLTMLTGETPKTLRAAREVSVIVARIKPNFAIVRLDSGLEGIINHLYLTESDQPQAADQLVQRGQTMAAVIIQANVDEAGVQIELTARQAAFARAKDYTKTPLDSYFDQDQIGKDRDVMERKKRSEVNRSRRVIQHPNFHDFNSGQAEQHLANMQRGEVVVRPSSKGQDHMAVTWKVDEGVYQHIDVVEVIIDANTTQLIIDGKYQYSDLDELIVNHIQAMSRKVEELMAFEKYKGGTEEELHNFLNNWVKANPTRSAYAFGLNRKRPGYFNLSFKANKDAPIQTWPVKVNPNSYRLFDTDVGSIPDLCDAFKLRHLNQTQRGGAVGGGKTPYGAGRQTPGRTPMTGRATPAYGHITPNPQLGRTPNPYGQAPPMPVPVAAYGQQTPMQPPPSTFPPSSAFPPPVPSWPMPPPPSAPMQAGMPSGMNPERARMIAQSGPWGSGGGGSSGGSGW